MKYHRQMLTECQGQAFNQHLRKAGRMTIKTHLQIWKGNQNRSELTILSSHLDHHNDQHLIESQISLQWCLNFTPAVKRTVQMPGLTKSDQLTTHGYLRYKMFPRSSINPRLKALSLRLKKKMTKGIYLKRWLTDLVITRVSSSRQSRFSRLKQALNMW